MSLHAGKNPLTAFSASKTKELINDLLGEESINALNRVRMLTLCVHSDDTQIQRREWWQCLPWIKGFFV